jgi:SAM-dependent methyltransferase
MAIIQLKSTNPRLSFMIKKNPNTGMMLRSIRQGIAFGWYSDENTYNIYFKDAENDISYKQDKEDTFEYLNVSRYNTPLFPMNAISEFFSTALKSRHEQDTEGYDYELYVNLVHIEMPRYIEFFGNYFEGYSFQIEHKVHKSYSLSIQTKKGLHDLLNVANLLFLFLSMVGKEFMDVSEPLVAKYINQIQTLDAPYFIRYLFVRNILINKQLFYKFKKDLENTEKYNIQFAYGNTAHQRRAEIKRLLPFNKSIVDVGCGEGYYAFPFSQNIEDHSYYAIDTDEAIIQSLDAKIDKKGKENIVTFQSIHEFLDDYNGEEVDVILTEVIEHMSKEDAEHLITTILDQINFSTFIITTPNHDFNQFYVLDEYRHEDHHWEIGEKEFWEWMNGIFKGYDLEIHHLKIGDQVNGISTTQSVLVKRR